MQFDNIYNLKRIFLLLKQISKDMVFIHSDKPLKGIHFSTINQERTVLLDVFLQKEETITNEDKKAISQKKFSFKTGKLFYDIMDTVESGSDVNIDFSEDDLNITIIYEDIILKSLLNATPEKFKGFPTTK